MIKQAVIVAGGLGKRLLPLTLKCPKPAIHVNGKPFIAYILEDLFKQGVEEAFILGGHMSQTLDEMLNKALPFSITKKIKVRSTPTEYETGRRILSVADEILGDFIFLYGDNYWPFEIKRLQENRLKSGHSAQIVGYENSDGYSTSNVRVDENMRATSYTKNRGSRLYSHVDLGFGLFKKKHLELLDDEQNLPFENQVYNKLIKRNDLGVYETSHRYYTLTNLPRYHFLQKILRLNQPALIDGSLFDHKNWDAVNETAKLKLLERLCGSLKKDNREIKEVILLIYEPRLHTGEISQPDFDIKFDNVIKGLESLGVKCEGVVLCPDHRYGYFEYDQTIRALTQEAQKTYIIDLSKTIFINNKLNITKPMFV